MPFARKKDPVTSFEAAGSVKNLTNLKIAILDCLSVPMHDEDLVRFIQFRYGHEYASPSGIRSRRAELTRVGLVKDSGDREKLKSGRQAIVWVSA